MAKKKEAAFSFDNAYQELEEILSSLQADDSLDGIETKIKKAKELIIACKTKLRDLDTLVDETINPEA